MTGRLPSGVLVSALLRRVNDAGGIGAMLARGDSASGAILVIALEKGENPRALERGIGPEGTPRVVAWQSTRPDQASDIFRYWQDRRRHDPDLWVIELDIPHVERFVAETILDD